nr:hypothetical protein [uncultured Clostridium sp.]
MDSLKEIQIEFFETIKSIQDAAVYQALGEYDKSDSLEDLLYNATYEAISSIFELIDGYTNENLKLDLVEKNSNISLKTGIQMHDKCADYLKWKSEK